MRIFIVPLIFITIFSSLCQICAKNTYKFIQINVYKFSLSLLKTSIARNQNWRKGIFVNNVCLTNIHLRQLYFLQTNCPNLESQNGQAYQL